MPDWVDAGDWEALQATFSAGRLVLFVGSGVSAAAGLPLWPQLTEMLLERMRRQTGLSSAAAEASESLRRGRLVDAISVAQHALGPTVFGDVVAKALDDRGKDVPAVARAIAALRGKLHGAITTNLDRFLERASEGQWLESVRPVGDLTQEPGFLWKAHGTIQDRATWVFARDAYDRVMFGDPQYRATFDAVYRARTLLFVGCSLSDDDLDVTLAEVRALAGAHPPRHFALLEGPIGDYRRRTLEQAGIRILEYTKGRHELVVELLQELGGTPKASASAKVTEPGGSAATAAASPARGGDSPTQTADPTKPSGSASDTPSSAATPVDVFLCSAYGDASLRDELVTHLAPLIARREIRVWHAGRLSAGANIQRETNAQLDRARLVLALTTAEFLASGECGAQLERARRRGATIVPVLARPCLWEVSALAGAKLLPVNEQPVSLWKDRSAAWLDVVRGVRAAVSRLSMVPAPDPSRAPRM